MGEFDFTYSVPANFNKRVVQFLQQFGKAHVAQAFQRCEYEYEDLGLAYYAGMKGDNWNKNALDFTFEGAESDIALLQSFDSVLQDAIGKALKASESGLLVRKVYYFASDSTAESTMIPPSNEERLNADMAAAQSVLDDLIQVGERVCLNASFTASSSENTINDYFRDMLSFKGYNEVKDQTRHGISASGKDAAEVDILLTKAGREIAIFEGLKLDSVSTVYIDAHIDKAIVNYNALGTATFLIHKKPPFCWMLDHPKIFECFSDCFFLLRWALWLSGILGLRQIVVLADFQSAFSLYLRNIKVGNL